MQDFQPNHTLENCPGREYVINVCVCVLNLLGHMMILKILTEKS